MRGGLRYTVKNDRKFIKKLVFLSLIFRGLLSGAHCFLYVQVEATKCRADTVDIPKESVSWVKNTNL